MDCPTTPLGRLVTGLLLATALGIPSPAGAAAKTDIVKLANGDHITGEIKKLDRGRLEFSTDDAGTIYFEWDKILQVESSQFFEVVTTDGRRFLGSLQASAPRSIAIGAPTGIVTLPMMEVTNITPIGASFWSRLDGSFDTGFSYTRSSGIAQLNVNSTTSFRRPAFAGNLAASITITRTDEGGGRDDRGWLEASYVRYRWQKWFAAVMTRFETNESLGLRLRSQVGAAAGPRLVNTNRAQLVAGGGLVVNDERAVDAESTRNLEALLFVSGSYFTYDRPKTNLDLTVQYYPSLSNVGRNRLQLDAGVKREVFKDFFVALNLYDTYDSRPPTESAQTNDIGVVFSIGWSY